VQRTKPNPILHVLPSFTDVAFLFPVAFVFLAMRGAKTLLGDGDTGWHIRAGEWMWANGRVPTQDLFSFTRPDAPWFAWEWLWDVVFAWIHRSWGLGGVVFASLLVIAWTSALVYRLAYRRSGHPLVSIALVMVMCAGSAPHWLARPHLFTQLFSVVFLSVLDRVHGEGRTRLLWALPLVTVVWTNLHGGFLVGIIILGAFAGGELAKALISADRVERVTAARASLPYLYAAAGCGLASVVNPYTYQLHVHIYEYLRDPFTREYIDEFQSLNFRRIEAVFFELMLVLSAGAAIWYGARRRFGETLLIVGWSHLALGMVRNIPIFMIVTTPVVAVAVVSWLRAVAAAPVPAWLRGIARTVDEIGREIGEMERPWRLHLVSLAALAVLAAAIFSPEAGFKARPEFDPATYPYDALGRLDRPGQRIFTDDEWGDYLIYHLWPKGTRVFVDGRSDFYGQEFGEEHLDVRRVKYTWAAILAKYDVDTILLPVDAALAGALKESRRWRVDYDDGIAIVFRPAG
jgi:hypothetical protein